MTETVILENTHVRVTRVTLEPGETHQPQTERGRRLVIHETDSAAHHQTTNRATIIERAAGDVVWLEESKSAHAVTNVAEGEHSVLLVEVL